MHKSLAIALTLLLLPRPSFGWSARGHMVVAYIAYQKLEPAVKDKVAVLLEANPDFNSWVKGMDTTPANQEQRRLRAFMRASIWADDIKGKSDFIEDGPNGGNSPPSTPQASQNIGYADKFMHKYWHYHDTPFTSDGTPLTPAPPVSALSQIPMFRDALKTSTDAGIRSYDLVWLIHLVGDVHQPLHAASRFTANHAAGDDGGNQQMICGSTGCSARLHTFWDALLGGAFDIEGAAALGQALLAEFPGAPSAASNSTVSVWLDESFKLAKQRSYPSPIASNGAPSLTNSNYRKKAHEVAEKQALLAGFRLANLINEALR